MVEPLIFLWKIFLKFILVKLYSLVYLPIKKQLIKVFQPAKNKLAFIFASRYFKHALIVIIGILVSLVSVQAGEIRTEDLGKKSMLYSLVMADPQGGLIEERADKPAAKSISYLSDWGVKGMSFLTEEETEEETAVAQGGSSLMKPSIPTTTVGDRPREAVEYYIVQGGDTVSSIAEDFKVSVNTILWENNLGPKDFIKPGDKLTILPLSGVSHQVKKGETLGGIAQKYDVDQERVIDYNQLASAETIKEGQILILPGGEKPAPQPTVKTQTGSTYRGIFIPPSVPATPGPKLLWPTTGRRISQYYHWRHHAIDISGNYSSPIYAADSGRVESVGWGRGYGNRIIVNHGDKKTLYAHLSKIFVRNGDSVSRGQTIGMMGCTGWCTGTHLHFEVIIGGSKVNPLQYL